ncbi:MAG: hypothetical protein GXP55_22060 [Deltaproteobacteria bacterium]|nr:hypothetical protein [Deltaproteobacteria bacterium]
MRRSGIPWWILPIVVVSATALLTLVHFDYYRLAYSARFDASKHSWLRPSGLVGHGYGIAGGLLIASNLLYLVRRRFPRVRALGSMRSWMRWHVFSGLVGPALVMLHSAFTLRTWPAMLSAGALSIVVTSGIVGRYLYGLIPRARAGQAVSHEQMCAELDRALMQIRASGQSGRVSVDSLEAAADELLSPLRRRRAAGLAAVPATLTALLRLRSLGTRARLRASRDGASVEELERIERAAARIRALILPSDFYGLLAGAASSWRGLHRVLAVVMILTAGLHVTVALYLGFGL